MILIHNETPLVSFAGREAISLLAKTASGPKFFLQKAFGEFKPRFWAKTLLSARFHVIIYLRRPQKISFLL